MNIPSNLTKEHFLKAFNKIDQEGIPANGHSSTYDVLYNGKPYPPKLVVSYANLFANGNKLDRSSFTGGKGTDAFKILKTEGFEIVEKNEEFRSELLKFLDQSKTDNLGYGNYRKRYKGLKIKVSFGKGNQALIPWIAFLGPHDSVMDGIYPGYLLFKKQKKLILIYGKSETNKSTRKWKVDRELKTISSFFSENNLEKPKRYGDSYVFKAYNVDNLPSKEELNRDLDTLIEIYKTQNSNLVSINKLISEESKEFDYQIFKSDTKAAGLTFNNKLIVRFIASLCTKPFVILTGLSGSGKTKIAQSFAQWISENESQYAVVPVGADWTNKEPLLGYPNALDNKDYVNPENGVLDLIKNAISNTHLPYFLILDEMNLSHVERYFAEFLSAMESNEEISLHNGFEEKNGVPPKITLPRNLFLVGTVNIDETTYMFSPKVLDRANTIEFRITETELQQFFNDFTPLNLDILKGQGANMGQSFLDISENKKAAFDESLKTTLLKFFNELKKTGAEFGYRTASEISTLYYQLQIIDNNLTEDEKLDIAIMQKLLPKLHGSRRKLCPVLITLGSFCIEKDLNIETDIFENSDFDLSSEIVKYPLSLEKIKRMYKGAIDHGFASYAEA